MASKIYPLYIAALRDFPGQSRKELAKRLGVSHSTVGSNLDRFGLKLWPDRKNRPTVDNFIGDLFRDMEAAGIDHRKTHIPSSSSHVYKVGKIFPTLARIKELEKIAGSKIVTTGRIRAKLEKIRTSTNDLETLSACAIMADIISEIEDE